MGNSILGDYVTTVFTNGSRTENGTVFGVFPMIWTFQCVSDCPIHVEFFRWKFIQSVGQPGKLNSFLRNLRLLINTSTASGLLKLNSKILAGLSGNVLMIAYYH